MPRGLKSRFIVAIASPRVSADCAGSATANPSAAARSNHAGRVFTTSSFVGSPFDPGALVDAAVRVGPEVGEQRAHRVGGVSRLGEALLAEAVPHAPLQRVHDAAGHAVARPALEAADRLLGVGEIGQRLRPDALAVFSVTARA